MLKKKSSNVQLYLPKRKGQDLLSPFAALSKKVARGLFIFYFQAICWAHKHGQWLQLVASPTADGNDVTIVYCLTLTFEALECFFKCTLMANLGTT